MIPVIRYSDSLQPALVQLLSRLGLDSRRVSCDQPIDGSFWGDEEAGLVGHTLVFRSDTPLHSILHETCHYVCMDEQRRAALHTNAGGDHDEENAVCYLQILMADEIPGFGRKRMLADMDAWGYSFRLGSARAWFENDAGDARRWLQDHGLINSAGELLFTLRDQT